MSSELFTPPVKQNAPLKTAAAVVIACALLSSGCHDGPLYALKVVNPFFSLGEWKKDEQIGVTDHQRRKQLAILADTIGSMPPNKQQFWSEQLKNLIEHDKSPEMRRLAVRAAGNVNNDLAYSLIEKGLDDDSVKVRMEACQSLGRRSGEDPIRALASVAGTETSEDVRHAALTALANHNSPIAVKALRIALADRNPATQNLAIESLKDVTGKNYGEDPQAWIAALDGTPTPEVETRIAEQVRELF